MKPPPEICDFDCPYAAFPPAETAGICRTMSAVQCRLLKALVNKNKPCEWRRRQAAANPPDTDRGSVSRPSSRRTRRT